MSWNIWSNYLLPSMKTSNSLPTLPLLISNPLPTLNDPPAMVPAIDITGTDELSVDISSNLPVRVSVFNHTASFI